MRREGERWHLTLQRLVEPLVVRPRPAQHMRLQLAGQTWPLAQWGSQAIPDHVRGLCGVHAAPHTAPWPAPPNPCPAHEHCHPAHARPDEVDRLIEQFDPESNFRRLVGVSAGIVTVIAVALSAWHYYTAGYGLHNEIAHRANHLSVVLGLCFLVFPRQNACPGLGMAGQPGPGAVLRCAGLAGGAGRGRRCAGRRGAGVGAVLLAICGLSLPFKAYDGSHQHIPWRDWIFAVLAASFSLYRLAFFDSIFIQAPRPALAGRSDVRRDRHRHGDRGHAPHHGHLLAAGWRWPR